MKTRWFIFFFSLLSAFSIGAVAQPDFSGYWLIDFGPIPPNRPATELEQSLLDTLPSDTLLLADTGLVEFPPGDFGGLDITPVARAEAQSYDVESQRQVSTTCRSPSIIYSMQGPFPFEIHQGSELIVMRLEYFDVTRVIFMNETSHPERWPHSLTGHSIGRWEGDTLVVETVKIQASTILNNGMNHSENIKLTEHFRLSDDGQQLVMTQLYEDPTMFSGKVARIIPVNKQDDHIYPYDCDPSYGTAMENREQN